MNEAFGWCAIAVGLLSGGWIGLNFERPGWLGGYDALPRRMVRLGHIACVMLGVLNIFFEISRPRLALSPWLLSAASASWVVGAVSMPLACWLMAWKPAFKPLFGIPVASLLLAVLLTCAGILS